MLLEDFNIFMWYALIVTAILFLVSSIDDVCFDIIYWVRHFYRKFKLRKFPPLTYEKLCQTPEKKIALVVPCWQEEDVIGDMLRHNLPRLDYSDYDVFIGVYPNDQGTIDAVKKVEDEFYNVYTVVADNPGPTSKADNLNCVYRYICKREADFRVRYEIIMMHDSEDVIHPLELKLVNYLIPHKDMVQTPVFPLEIQHRNWSYWTYADEFAELHTKEMVIREFLKGFVPSAGVGTSFARHAIEMLAERYGGKPFSTKSLVEDYDCALRLQLTNLKTIFLVQHVERLKRKRNWLGFKITRKVNEMVATRALFPRKYHLAVRQRSRWVFGIALQQWKLMGWPGNWVTRYFLLHDRKAAITNFINFTGYLIFLYWIVMFIGSLFNPDIKNLGHYIQRDPWVFTIIVMCTLAMLNRLLQRAIATYRVYGLIAALLSVPRVVFSNAINLHAITRAYVHYLLHIKVKGFVKWGKTKNHFPDEKLLRKYNRKLGDILLLNKTIGEKDLIKALKQQEKTGEKLGVILMNMKKLDSQQLLEALAKNYHMSIVNVKKKDILPLKQLDGVDEYVYEWMIDNYLYPIQLQEGVMTLALSDPGNEEKRKDAEMHLWPLRVRFVLTGWSSDRS